MKQFLILCLACWSLSSPVMAQTYDHVRSSIKETEVVFITFTNGTSYAPPTATPNTANNPIGRFVLTANSGTLTLNFVKVTSFRASSVLQKQDERR